MTALETITDDEAQRLTELERVVEAGMREFVAVGRALQEIRDSRLYRAEYPTFEAYCVEQWGLGKAYAHRMITAAHVVDVSPIGDSVANEAQARELARVAPEQHEAIAAKAKADAGGALTAAGIRKAIRAWRGGGKAKDDAVVDRVRDQEAAVRTARQHAADALARFAEMAGNREAIYLMAERMAELSGVDVDQITALVLPGGRTRRARPARVRYRRPTTKAKTLMSVRADEEEQFVAALDVDPALAEVVVAMTGKPLHELNHYEKVKAVFQVIKGDPRAVRAMRATDEPEAS
jgi:hypothetical protein